jgi:tRNA modification GTPase
MKSADLVLYLFDVEEEMKDELDAAYVQLQEVNPSYLLVGNKADIIGEEWATKKFDGIDAVYISAKTHYQVDNLKEKLVEKVVQGKVNTESTIVTNSRHYNSLLQVDKSLKDIRLGLDANISGDLLALDIRRCLHYLGEITGEITNEDQLDYIFSKFCIGK